MDFTQLLYVVATFGLLGALIGHVRSFKRVIKTNEEICELNAVLVEGLEASLKQTTEMIDEIAHLRAWAFDHGYRPPSPPSVVN